MMGENGWLERDLVGDTSGHECATRLWLAAASKTALRDPRAAILSALALTGACLAGTPGIVLAVPMAYALRFAIALLDRRARRATRRHAGALAIALPSALSFSDESARRLIERLERARWATESAILASPGGSPFALTGLIDEIPQLERDVVILAARIEYVGRFLSSAPSAGILAEIERMDQERDKETNAGARHDVERLLARCREHRDTLKLLDVRKTGSLRRAEEVLGTLEQIPAKIVSLQLARVESCDGRCGDSGQRAETIGDAFTALERAISPFPSTDTSSSP